MGLEDIERLPDRERLIAERSPVFMGLFEENFYYPGWFTNIYDLVDECEWKMFIDPAQRKKTIGMHVRSFERLGIMNESRLYEAEAFARTLLAIGFQVGSPEDVRIIQDTLTTKAYIEGLVEDVGRLGQREGAKEYEHIIDAITEMMVRGALIRIHGGRGKVADTQTMPATAQDGSAFNNFIDAMDLGCLDD